VSADAAPERIAVVWSPESRADLRAIERETAMQILRCVDRYLAYRAGDVKKLKPPLTGFRLRCGDYRVFFGAEAENHIEITGVRNRREATAELKDRSARGSPAPWRCSPTRPARSARSGRATNR